MAVACGVGGGGRVGDLGRAGTGLAVAAAARVGWGFRGDLTGDARFVVGCFGGAGAAPLLEGCLVLFVQSCRGFLDANLAFEWRIFWPST